MKNLLLLIIVLFPFVCRAQSVSVVATDTTVCAGTSVTFTATAAGIPFPDYWWKINGTHVGTNSTTFTTSSLANGDTVRCYVTNGGILMATSSDIVMGVDTMPYAGLITGADTVCLGATVTLSSSVFGGIWNRKVGYVSVDSGIVNGNYTGYKFECYIKPGYDTVLYVVSNACASDTAYKPILVHPLANPFFFLNDYVVCKGGVLHVNGGAGFCAPMYSTNGCFEDNWGSEWLGAIKSGKDYVYCIATNYCGTQTYGEWITVIDKSAPPTIISSEQALCVGASITLSDATMYALREWQINDGNTVRSSSYSKDITIRGVYAGISTITLRHDDRCGSSKTSIVVTVNPNPRPSTIESSSCEDMTLQLMNTTAAGVWSTANKYMATVDQAGKVTAVTPGDVFVRYTLPTGCSTLDGFVIRDCDETIKVYPVPADEEITIHTLAPFSECVVTNNLGQVTLRQTITGEYFTIDTHDLVPGMYFVTLTGRGGRHTAKFVKQ